MGSENTDPKTAALNSKARVKKKGAKVAHLPSVDSVESKLPWHVEYGGRAGRSVVADEDLEAGTLILLEHPAISLPMARFSNLLCHRCLRPLETASERTTAGSNPCLPRHCGTCKAVVDSKIQNALAPLRIKIPEIAESQQVDPLLIHFTALMDLNRAGVMGDDASAEIFGTKDSKTIPVIRSTVADIAAHPNVWDKKEEGWRKKAAGAVRALHKELKALAEAGTLPGYTPGSIQDLQADFSKINVYLQPISNHMNGNMGFGLFPSLCVFAHSCQPNCFFTSIGGLVCVRTVMPVPKGTHLTISFCKLCDTRDDRHAALADKHIICSCQRCSIPIHESVDRYLEGLWCRSCMQDVVIALKPGPENDEAYKQFQEELEKEQKALEAAKARALKAKAKAKHHAHKAGAKASNNNNKTSAGADADKAAADETEEGSSSDKQQTTEAEKTINDEATAVVAASDEAQQQQEEEGQEEEEGSANTKGLLFWKCAGCGFIEPAHNVQGSGPGDLMIQAGRILQQATIFIETRHAALIGEAEELLGTIQQGMKGRLCPYNSKIFEALTPLINLNIRKNDPMKVINLTLQLWNIEHDFLGGMPTMTQLQCLDAMIKAAEDKAANTTSTTMKRQFEKKLKQATIERKMLRKVLLGK